MTKLVLGIILGVILVPLAVVAYLISGHAPAAVADTPMPFERQIAGMALRKRIMKEAPQRDLSGMTTADLLAGADIYQKDCAMCHGLPDQPPPGIAKSMFPEAPQLMMPPQDRGGRRAPEGGEAGQGPARGRPGRGAGRDFWRVKNGIRLTGMPSFQSVLSEDQMWQVVALLANRRNLPPEVKDALKPEREAATSPAPPIALKKKA